MNAYEMKVLLVDDFGTIRSITKLELTRLGFQNIEEAGNGLQAWEKIEAAANTLLPFTLIICDWNMPEMTGLELLEKLRADARFKKLPFIMVTAESETQSVMKAIKAGTSDYVVKPIAPDALMKKVQRIIESFGKDVA